MSEWKPGVPLFTADSVEAARDMFEVIDDHKCEDSYVCGVISLWECRTTTAIWIAEEADA